jgi:hypothetical protein
MFNLYFLMSALFVVMAVLAAADASLTSLNVLPWFNGLRWVRVHLITLGAMTEALFGALPLLTALHFNRPRPRFRWDIWLTLNAGLLTLLIGIPIVNQALILTGGTLIFTATTLLIIELSRMRPAAGPKATPPSTGQPGRPFYIAGLSFFLLGILIGTGLWFGWGEALRIRVPLEAHIHANNWGLMALVFAGLIIDTYPRWAGRSLAWPRSLPVIFWLMVLGALGLVLGPWFQSTYFTVPGLVMHLTATFWLLLNVVQPLRGERTIWSAPGIWHLLTSYFWIIAPVMMAPLILLGVAGIPGATIEANAPQALIYGWVFQFGFAMLPFFFRRAFLPGEPSRLGGNWFSLVAANLGGLFLWASIFVAPLYATLHGIAYALWAAAAVPVALELWGIVRRGMARLDAVSETAAGAAD